jgi:hypothetical protein
MRKGVANGVINVAPREFEFPSKWYYIVQRFRNCQFGEITYGIALQNHINFRPAIL